jgi:adiponectin receptor
MNHRKPVSRSSVHDEPDALVTQTHKTSHKALTVSWSEIEPWQRDNHYIHTGYRPTSNSFYRSFASLSYIHNETVNIYTHLLGAFASLISAAYMFSLIKPRYEKATTEDVMVFACFFGGAAACLGMSATFHTISNHSPTVSKVGNQLDYVGIVCLIWGSFIPSIFYAFAREPAHIAVYWSMVCLFFFSPLCDLCILFVLTCQQITLIGFGCATVSILPSFRTPRWRPFRAAMFVAMGLSAVIPVLHGVSIYGIAQLDKQMGLSYVVTQGVLYVLGAAIYAVSLSILNSPPLERILIDIPRHVCQSD